MKYFDITIAYRGGAVVAVKGVVEVSWDPGKQISWVCAGDRVITSDPDEIVHIHYKTRYRPILWLREKLGA